MLDDFTQKSLNLSKQVTTNIEMRINFFKQMANMYIKNSNMGDTLREPNYQWELNRTLSNFRNFSQYCTSIYAYNTSGVAYFSNSIYATPMHQLFIDRLHESTENEQWLIINQQDDQPHVSTNSRILFYIVKIFDSNGQFSGVVIINTSLNLITDAFSESNQSFFQNSNYYLISNKRDCITILQSNTIQNDKIDQYLKLDNSWEYTSDNKNVIISNPIVNTNLDILIHLPLSSLSNQIKQLRMTLIGFCTIFMIISFFATFILIKSIINPLTNLFNKIQNYLGK